MYQLFENYTLKILNSLKPKRILEIGVFEGANTAKILGWCKSNGSHLTSVDPCEWTGDVLPKSFRAPYKNNSLKLTPKYLINIYEKAIEKFWSVKKKTSLDYLKNEKKKFDLIILDGDHNYYTVLNELNSLKKNFNKNFCILLHDIYGKWARNDKYYNISEIPKRFRYSEKEGVMEAVDEFLRSNNGIRIGSLSTSELIIQKMKELKYDSIFSKIKACRRILPFGNDLYHSDTIYNTILKNDLKDEIITDRKQKKKIYFFVPTNRYYGLGVITNNLRILEKDFFI